MKIRDHSQPKTEKSNPDLDWRDPFLHLGGTKLSYAQSNTICLTTNGSCTNYSALLAYITQFTQGGIWYTEEGVFVVTRGIGSDPEATYDDASEFMKNWRKK